MGTFEGSASATLWLKNDKTYANGWLSYPIKTTSWGNGTCDYGTGYNNQYISGSVESGHNIHILGRFSDKIILTPYNTLHVYVSTSYSNNTMNLYRIGVGVPSMTGNGFSSYADCGADVSQVWYSIGVGGLSGEFCVFAFLESNGGGSRFSASGSINIYQAYLD